MQIPDDELRSLVRSAIAQRSGRQRPHQPIPEPVWNTHASHRVLQAVGSGDSEGHCLIEPAVICSHCGYCRSLGH